MITYDFTQPVKLGEKSQKITQILIQIENLVITKREEIKQQAKEKLKETNIFWTLPMVQFVCAACMCIFLFLLFKFTR